MGTTDPYRRNLVVGVALSNQIPNPTMANRNQNFAANHADLDPASDPASTTGKPESIHDSARGTPEPANAFDRLVQSINTILGPCNGIDSAGIDVEELKTAMRDYPSIEQEWEKF